MSDVPASAKRTAPGTPPRIAVLFHRLGPYHHGRLRAAAQHAEIVAVEFSAADKTYAWDSVAPSAAFGHVTLFHDREIDEQPVATVLLRVARALRAIRPDAVAVPGWSSRGAIAALLWCRLTGVPAIVMSASTLRDHPRDARKEWLKRQILRLSAGALAGGQAQADYLALLGVPRGRVFSGYDVVDNDHFASGAAAARAEGAALRARLGLPERYFLASSRFIPKKNLARLLQAFAKYRQDAGPEGWSLVLIGDGPETPKLRAAIAAQELGEAVLLPGFKQYDELPAYYGLAGAFVLASTSEQWGLVVNEAMAAGLPVLVSNVCGCAVDLVEEGRNGYSFDPTDVDALAGLLARIAAPDCDRMAIGEASRQIIRRWSPRTFAEGLLMAVGKAFESRPGAGRGPSRPATLPRR